MHICIVLGVYKKRFAGESFALFLVCKDLEFESQDMQFFDGYSALGQGSKLYRLGANEQQSQCRPPHAFPFWQSQIWTLHLPYKVKFLDSKLLRCVLSCLLELQRNCEVRGTFPCVAAAHSIPLGPKSLKGVCGGCESHVKGAWSARLFGQMARVEWQEWKKPVPRVFFPNNPGLKWVGKWSAFQMSAVLMMGG